MGAAGAAARKLTLLLVAAWQVPLRSRCAAQQPPAAPTFVGFAGFEDCQGCRGDACCLALTSPRGACGCRGADLLVPGDIRGADDRVWDMVDWPLDDVCARTYPGSRAATMLELVSTPRIKSLPNRSTTGFWLVPGCQGSHDLGRRPTSHGAGPNATKGSSWPAKPAGKQWMCSYAGAGDYRWALPPGQWLFNATDGPGWDIDRSPAYYEGDVVGSFYCADVSRELPGLTQAICVSGKPAPAPPPPLPPPPPPTTFTTPFIRFGNAVPSSLRVACTITQGAKTAIWSDYAFGQFSGWEEKFTAGPGSIECRESTPGGRVITTAQRSLTPGPLVIVLKGFDRTIEAIAASYVPPPAGMAGVRLFNLSPDTATAGACAGRALCMKSFTCTSKTVHVGIASAAPRLLRRCRVHSWQQNKQQAGPGTASRSRLRSPT
eukprot:SAG22_NODE_804_length_7097_cov_173.117176_2_plen_433_part_00